MKITILVKHDIDVDGDKCGLFCSFGRRDSCNISKEPFYKCWDVCKIFKNVKIINKIRCQPCRAAGMKALFEKAETIELTDEEKEEQRRNFAHGNAHLHNPDITRDIIDKAADKIDAEKEAVDGTD